MSPSLVAGQNSAENAPSIPPTVSSVVTGGYWEEGEHYGVVRIVIVQEGFEEITSRVFLEWLQEDPTHGLQVVQRDRLTEIENHVGWSLGTPRLQQSTSGLIVELPATNSYSQESKWLRAVVHGPGEFEVETGP